MLICVGILATATALAVGIPTFGHDDPKGKPAKGVEASQTEATASSRSPGAGFMSQLATVPLEGFREPLPDPCELAVASAQAVCTQGEMAAAERARVAYQIFRRDCELLFDEERQVVTAYEKEVQSRYDRMRELGKSTRNVADIQKVMQLSREADQAARHHLTRLEVIHGRAMQLARKEAESGSAFRAVWISYADYLLARLELGRSKGLFFTFQPNRDEYLPSVDRINQQETQLRAAALRFVEAWNKRVPPTDQ